jgi:hypothetical protein
VVKANVASGRLRYLDWPLMCERMGRPLILDCRNLLDPRAMTSLGFEYYSVGRQPEPTKERLGDAGAAHRA